MSDKGISRDVGTGSKRTVGDKTGLEGFSKAGDLSPIISDSSAKGEKRWRRNSEGNSSADENDPKRANSAMIRTMLMGAAGVGVIAVAVGIWLLSERERREGAKPYRSSSLALQVVEAPENPKLDEDEAIALAKRAMAARSEEEILSVINPGSVPVKEIAEYLKTLQDQQGSIAGYHLLPRLDSPREDLMGVVVLFSKEGNGANRIAMLSPDEDGNWKMDYPAFSRLATPPWTDLLTGPAKSAVVRVFVQRDQYFNGPFREGDGWVCYGVASPDVDQLLLGYCKKDSPQDNAIRSLLKVRKMGRATVELEKAEGADNRQFVIKRVLAHDWLVGDKPADEEGS
jgi:hypothetical protein